MDEFTPDNLNQQTEENTGFTEEPVRTEYNSSSLNRESATNYTEPQQPVNTYTYASPNVYTRSSYQPSGTYNQATNTTYQAAENSYQQPYRTYGYQNPTYSAQYGYSQQTPLADEKPKKKEKKGLSKGGLIAICIILSLLAGMGGSVLGNVINHNIGGTTAAKPNTSTVLYQQVEGSATDGSVKTGNPVSDVVNAVQDTVVSITTEELSTSAFFSEYVETGAGSGVIISEDGYIVTCNHVVDGASHIVVDLYNGEQYEATVVGADSRTDLAVLKIEATGLKAAVLGNSDELPVGSQVVAIGNPLGTLGNSVSSGILSAKERKVTVSNQQMVLLQTDAAVNPGNSGGGLFDTDGYLIGIVNAKSAGSDVEGLGFAIPIDTARTVVETLIENGYVTGRPGLGVQVITVSDMSQAAQYGVSRLGVYIYTVNEGEAADKAGLKSGDYIFSVDGTVIEDYTDLSSILSSHEVGDTINMVVIRDNQTVSVDITLCEIKG